MKSSSRAGSAALRQRPEFSAVFDAERGRGGGEMRSEELLNGWSDLIGSAHTLFGLFSAAEARCVAAGVKRPFERAYQNEHEESIAVGRRTCKTREGCVIVVRCLNSTVGSGSAVSVGGAFSSPKLTGLDRGTRRRRGLLDLA
ncbi:hypothetical protein B0H11DRAFT_1905216 [Mycena galericulata]|nr:hypothetical protein B0H11DRAFT_1905216 [Mycena galericulata]